MVEVASDCVCLPTPEKLPLIALMAPVWLLDPTNGVLPPPFAKTCSVREDFTYILICSTGRVAVLLTPIVSKIDLLNVDTAFTELLMAMLSDVPRTIVNDFDTAEVMVIESLVDLDIARAEETAPEIATESAIDRDMVSVRITESLMATLSAVDLGRLIPAVATADVIATASAINRLTVSRRDKDDEMEIESVPDWLLDPEPPSDEVTVIVSANARGSERAPRVRASLMVAASAI